MDPPPSFTLSKVWQILLSRDWGTRPVSLLRVPPPDQRAGGAGFPNQALEAIFLAAMSDHQFSPNPASWSQHLPWVRVPSRKLHGELGHRPVPTVQCALGYQPPLLAVPFRAQLRRCRRVWKTARNAMVTNSDRVQRAANRRRVPASAYHPGQKVWLLAHDLPLPTFSRKLAPRYVGLYVIEKVVNPAALRLLLPPSLKVHPVFHVSQVKPVATSALSPPAPTPPPPRSLESGDLVWEVSRILAVCRRGRGFQYLVDWVGYGPEDRSWVPRSYLADPGLLGDFYRRNPQAVGRSPGVSRREGGPVADQRATMPPPSHSSHCCTKPRADPPTAANNANTDELRFPPRRLQNPSETSLLVKVFHIVISVLWDSSSVVPLGVRPTASLSSIRPLRSRLPTA